MALHDLYIDLAKKFQECDRAKVEERSYCGKKRKILVIERSLY